MVAVWRSVAARSEAIGDDAVVAKPTGTVDGDLLIAIGVAGTGGTIAKPDASWNTASFSLGAQGPFFWKIASSEPANWTFVITGVVPSIVSVVRIDGHHPTTPIDAGSANFVLGTGPLAIPSVTSAGSNRLLMQMVAKVNNTTFTGPGSQTERYDALAPSQTIVYAGGDEVVGAGATGTRTWTPAAGAGQFIAYMAAIAPAPPSSGTFTGAYDFTGSGFTGEAGPGEGSFAGGYAFDGSGFTGAGGPGEGSFIGGFDFTGSGFTGSAPAPPSGDGRWTPGGRDRFTARRTPKNRRRSR